jgi:murein DD-endopeptidase MepM/ murein hydrolase activator NlpD
MLHRRANQCAAVFLLHLGAYMIRSRMDRKEIVMIVPEFIGKRPAYWNKPEWWAKYWRPAQKDPSKIDLADPANSQAMHEQALRVLEADYLYGGWMEDREPIWGISTYLKAEKKFIHLGLDIWVPQRTEVAVDREGLVVEVNTDSNNFLDGGWGTRVYVKLRYALIVLVYGHLAKDVQCEVGEPVFPEEALGYVGTATENGGWAPHIHVQALSTIAYEKHLHNRDELDGYGKADDIHELARLYPDPIRWIDLV